MRIKQGGIVGVVAMAAVALAGCDGVGDGSRPDPSTAKLVKSGGTAALNEDKLYTCVAQNLAYTIEFTNGGGVENFTNRATWRIEPAGTDIATITNVGEETGERDADGNKLFYQVGGLVLPKKAGNITVVANAFGIETRIPMTVQDPAVGSLKIRAVGYGDADATEIFMNHNTTQQLQLVATLEGFETALDSSLKKWILTNDDGSASDGSIAKFQEVSGQPTSILVSNGEFANELNTEFKALKDGRLIAKPELIACDDTNDLLDGLQLPVNVEAATGLVIQRELDDPVNGNVLAVNTSTTTPIATTELLRTYATFNGNTDAAQNLSGQVLPKSSDAAVIVPLAFSLRTGITALTTGTGTTPPTVSPDVTLTYCQPEPVPKDSEDLVDYQSKCWAGKPTTASIVFRTRQSTLASIAVSPSGDGIVIPALQTLQFRAEGTFDGGFKQDITRHVTWEAFANNGTTRSTKVAIATGTAASGLALSVFLDNSDDDPANGSPLEDRTVKIKATNNTASTTKTQTVTATLSR